MDGAGWRHPTPDEQAAWDAFCATLAPLQRATSGARRGAMRGVNAAHTHNPYIEAPVVEDFASLLAQSEAGSAPVVVASAPKPPTHTRMELKPSALPQPKQPIHPLGNVGLDSGQLRALRRGKLTMDYVLDLHGHSVPAAFARLRTTVLHARNHGHRALLVITGKGNARNPEAEIGKLRAAMPHWLSDAAIAPHVITAVPAAPAHGGEGAWYLLLRRPERGVPPHAGGA